MADGTKDKDGERASDAECAIDVVRRDPARIPMCFVTSLHAMARALADLDAVPGVDGKERFVNAVMENDRIVYAVAVLVAVVLLILLLSPSKQELQPIILQTYPA